MPAKTQDDAIKLAAMDQLSPASTNFNPTARIDAAAKPADSKEPSQMRRDSMQGGRPPVGARDANAYSDGYEYAGMPGLEKADQLPVAKVFVEQLEYTQLVSIGTVPWALR